MSWVRLDDACFTHPKLLAAGPEAAWFWVAIIGYCNRQKQRDGMLPDAAIGLVYPVKNAQRLIARLVELRLLERIEGGYRVHDYDEYQRPPDDDLRRVRSEAGRRGGLRSAATRREANDKQVAPTAEASCFDAAEANVKQPSEAPSRPVPSRPQPERESRAPAVGSLPLDTPLPAWAESVIESIAAPSLIEVEALYPALCWSKYLAKRSGLVSEADFRGFVCSWVSNFKTQRSERAARRAEEDRRAQVQSRSTMSPAIVSSEPDGPPVSPDEIAAGMAAIERAASAHASTPGTGDGARVESERRSS
jgi:hypothetical protein